MGVIKLENMGYYRDDMTMPGPSLSLSLSPRARHLISHPLLLCSSWVLMERCQQLIFSPIAAISQAQIEVSKKQKVESTKEEPSLVGFLLKLNLVDLMIRRGPPRKPLPYYWSGYWAIKSSTSINNLRDQETKVAGREALLNILAEIKEKPPELGFIQELILVLPLYHNLRNMHFYLFDRRDEENQPALRDAVIARATETVARAHKAYLERQRKRLEGEIKDVGTVK